MAAAPAPPSSTTVDIVSDQAIIVTGVSGSGKTTTGRLLADRLKWTFADADDFHPAGNVAKLAHGRPLDDADRAPWLAALGDWLDEQHRAGHSIVLACSALKRRYRDRLRHGRPQVRIVHLHGPDALIAQRLAHRTGHFMKAHMLEGQLSDLEAPAPDENVLTVDVDAPPDEIVSDIMSRLSLEPSA